MASAFWLGRDTVSRGDGSKLLGRKVYTHIGVSSGITNATGDGVSSFAWTGYGGVSYSGTGDTPRFLLLPDGLTRNPRSLTGNTTSLGCTITTADAAWRAASIYCIADAARQQEVQILDAATSDVLAGHATGADYQLGWWFRFAFSGSVKVQFNATGGSTTTNCTAIFVDPYIAHLAGCVPPQAYGSYAI